MAPPAVLTITITLDAARRVSVTGPLDDKLMVYGLLEVVRDLVRAHQPATGQIVLAPGPLPASRQ